MKLCIITSSFPANAGDAAAAAGLFVRSFAMALRDLGHDVTVVTPDKPGSKEAIEGLEVEWFSWAGGDQALAYMKPYRPLDALAMLSLFRQGRHALHQLAIQKQFDHTMAMWAVPAGHLARTLKRRHGIPYTTWCLGSDIWTYGKYPILKHVVASVIRASDFVYADGLELGAMASKLSGIHCPFLPSSRRLDRSLIEPVTTDKSGTRFLFVGRYAEVKGVDVLLAAMARFKSAGLDGHLQMFGGGPWADFVHEYVSEHNLQDRVDVGGYADEKTVVSQLEAADCLVISSRMESIPVVLSDALQMGNPVIVTDVGDMGALLRTHPAGLVVPPADDNALFEALKTMATIDRETYRPHIEALANTFDIKRVASSWLRDIGAGTHE